MIAILGSSNVSDSYDPLFTSSGMHCGGNSTLSVTLSRGLGSNAAFVFDFTPSTSGTENQTIFLVQDDINTAPAIKLVYVKPQGALVVVISNGVNTTETTGTSNSIVQGKS